MTNAERFKEVFGFKPDMDTCIAPKNIHIIQDAKHANDAFDEFLMCDDCGFKDWWDKEYKPCFVLASEYEDE